jgi:hypothetical protein
MSQSRPLPSVELLWERYSLNPFTGKFCNRRTGRIIHGNYVRTKGRRTRQAISIHWDGHSYCTAYARAVFAFITGKWPIHELDHIDQNPLNDRPWNLRDVTSRQNIQNRPNFGGTWVERKRKWQAQIRINGKVKWLGYHRTQADAVAAYWEAVERYGLADVRALRDG